MAVQAQCKLQPRSGASSKGLHEQQLLGPTWVVLPVRQASNSYALASGFADAAIAGFENSRSGSTTCTLLPSLEHVTATCCEAS